MPKPLRIDVISERSLVVTRDFNAPRTLVFLCYSKAELMRQWYGMPDWETIVCEIDFRVGGKYRLGQRSPQGWDLASQGIYTAIAEPERIEQTEYYDDDWTKGGSQNRIEFIENGGVTTTITTVTYETEEGLKAAVASPMAVGMEIGFKRLDDLLTAEQAD